MSLGTAVAVASGVHALGSYAYNRYKNNQRKKFGDTAHGKELKRVGEEGTFSQKAKNLIQGGQARASASVAQTAKSSYAGRLASQGLEGSVAGQRGMNEFDIARQRQAGETAGKIELENELSKADAKMTYAKAMTADENERVERERQAGQALVDGLGATAKAGVNAYYSDLATKRRVDAFRGVEDIGQLREAIGRGDLAQEDFMALIYLRMLEERQSPVGTGEEDAPYRGAV